MRERLALMAITVLMPAIIFAGGGAEGESSADSPAGTTISFASMNDPFAFVIEQMLPRFTEETGIEVNMDIIPYVGLRERTLTDLVSGSGSFDVITMDIVWMGEWAESGFITPLDDLIERDGIELDAFIPGALEGLTYWDGEAYGMPIGAYHFLMFYRKDLLQEAGLEYPETYAELIDVAGALQASRDDFYGIAAPMVRGAPVVHYSLAYLSGAGGGLFDRQGNVAIASDTSRQVFSYYRDFLEIGPPGMLSYDWFGVSEAYQQDRIAFLGAWNVIAGGLESPDESLVVGRSGYGIMPVLLEGDAARVPFGGWSLVVNAASREQAAAWEFIKWLTSSEVQREYARRGGTPIRFETLADPELQQMYPWYRTVLEIEQAGRSDANFRPRIPEWVAMEEALGLRLNEVMIGEVTVDEALDDLEQEFAEILQ